MDPIIKIAHLTKSFEGVMAVRELDFSIQRGEIFALLGSSGCGKSTLLRMLAGFEVPSAGKILFNGDDISQVPPYERPFNMMFQSYALFPHMTVEQNIAFGLKQQSLSKPEIQQRIDHMLELVHMSAYRRRKPHQLSGGQRQRVALARSLAKRPAVLLLDEPMGALDKKLRNQMQLEVVEIIKSVGVTCVMVTHDQEEAMTMADRIAVMNEGCMLQIGTPHEIYEYPNQRYVAEFIGSVNIISGQVIAETADSTTIDSEQTTVPLHVNYGVSGPPAQGLDIAIRPEKMLLGTQRPDSRYNWTQGKVTEIAYMGGHSVYHITTEGGLTLQAMQSNTQSREAQHRLQDRVYLQWQSDSGVVLK